VPVGEHTAVTWSRIGAVNFVAKTVHLCLDMDIDKRSVAAFEKDLAGMKAAVKAGVSIPAGAGRLSDEGQPS
jgi:hypothetical protein